MTTTFNDPRLPERIWEKIRVLDNGCWEWTGARSKNGYGNCGGADHRKRHMVHRFVYEALVGPAGEALDHLCHTNDPSCPGRFSCPHRRCVNPDHLEPVTNRENQLRSPHTIIGGNARKTHCKRGHPYDEENTRISQGARQCRTCDREAARRKLIRLREAGLNPKGQPYSIGPYPESRRGYRK